MKKLQNLGKVLTKQEQRRIGGGYGATGCAPDGTVCYQENGVNYECFTVVTQGDVVDCCCSHDAGNDNCSTI
jgi:hypothetical protein